MSAPTAPWICIASIGAIGKTAEGTGSDVEQPWLILNDRPGANKAKAADEACLKVLRLLGDSQLLEVASGR